VNALPVSESKLLDYNIVKPFPILAIAAAAMVGTLPGRTQGLGLITEPLIAELRLDRVDYAAINFWATLIGALFCLPCGRFTDRFGARAVQTAVIAALGLSVVALSRSHSLIALTIAVTLTRGFGQSALSVVSLALVGKHFRASINNAMAIYSLLVGIGFIAAFPSVGQAVLTYGWRTAWLAVAAALLGVLGPLSWLIVKDTISAEESATTKASDILFAEAFRTPAFWIFALASSLFGLVYSGIALFNESILEQRGFDAGVYHTVLVVSTMLGLAANFGAGWLATKWPVQRITGIGMAVLAAAVASLPYVVTFSHVMLYAAAMGIAGGVVTVVFFSVWGQVFGRTDLGRIQGAAQMMTVLASAIGPVLLAKTFEQTGSYAPVFLILAFCIAALGVASWRVRMPA
jgi:MFS family permease